MSQPVKLYVYDLSNGLARQLSRQLLGTQIDGIWHTSVVVFGKEFFYGMGIYTVLPGASHFGQPKQILDMGHTSIDEDIWQEFLAEMRLHYTADKYHLLDFNCNSFTNDCIGFLTGGSIPDFINNLPSDFLSTPFGAALRPTIDAMFRQPGPGRAAARPAPSSTTQADAILQSVSSQAIATPMNPSTTEIDSITSPIHLCTNPSHMQSLLRTHRAVVAFFTSATCGPCRMIEPTFERLAEEKTRGIGTAARQTAFVKIDLDVGLAGAVAREYGVRVTPTFIFLLDGKKIDEIKGADAAELRSQVNFLIHQAFPPHSHMTLSLPAIEALSLDPILFTQVPKLDAVLTKLTSFIDAHAVALPKIEIKETLTQSMIPFLKSRFGSESGSMLTATTTLLAKWSQTTVSLVGILELSELFPLVDMWRLAILDPGIATWCASQGSTQANSDPISALLTKAISGSEDSGAKPKPYILIVLRMLSNAFSSAALTRRLLSDATAAGERASLRTTTTEILIQTLLHEDPAVRTAAASLAFNVAAFIQKGRVENVRNGTVVEDSEDADWEVELISALIEAIGREDGSEEVVHRLTAALAFLLRLSPFYGNQIMPLLEVLQATAALKAKLGTGLSGEFAVGKKEVRKLILEVADKLCP